MNIQLLLTHFFRLGRASTMAFLLNLPPYLINLSFLSFLLWYTHVAGIGNVPYVFIGDMVGFGTGVLISYYVYARSKTIRRWGGSNEKTKCPKCGADL